MSKTFDTEKEAIEHGIGAIVTHPDGSSWVITSMVKEAGSNFQLTNHVLWLVAFYFTFIVVQAIIKVIYSLIYEEAIEDSGDAWGRFIMFPFFAVIFSLTTVFHVCSRAIVLVLNPDKRQKIHMNDHDFALYKRMTMIVCTFIVLGVLFYNTIGEKIADKMVNTQTPVAEVCTWDTRTVWEKL